MPPYQRLPEQLPAVAFDIRLGKRLPHGSVIDYDEEALNGALDHVDAPEDASDLTITIASPQSMRRGDRGYFDVPTNSIAVKFERNTRKTQNYLIHELQHYSDHENEHPAVTRHRLRSNLGHLALNISPYTGIGTGIWTVGTNIANAYSFQKTGQLLVPWGVADQVTYAAMGLSLSTMATAPLYLLDHAERRARHAANTYRGADQIIRLKRE